MRTTRLKRATTGVVIIVLLAVVLLGILRARVGHQAEIHHDAAVLFVEKGCARCHYTDRKDTKLGPGLKGLFARKELPVSGSSMSDQNVTKQLEEPYKNMPSFADQLTKEEKGSLIEYLKTL